MRRCAFPAWFDRSFFFSASLRTSTSGAFPVTKIASLRNLASNASLRPTRVFPAPGAPDTKMIRFSWRSRQRRISPATSSVHRSMSSTGAACAAMALTSCWPYSDIQRCSKRLVKARRIASQRSAQHRVPRWIVKSRFTSRFELSLLRSQRQDRNHDCLFLLADPPRLLVKLDQVDAMVRDLVPTRRA